MKNYAQSVKNYPQLAVIRAVFIVSSDRGSVLLWGVQLSYIILHSVQKRKRSAVLEKDLLEKSIASLNLENVLLQESVNVECQYV